MNSQHSTRAEYWMPPTCEGCGATLSSDGLHWASGHPDCYGRGAYDSDGYWRPVLTPEYFGDETPALGRERAS